MATYPIKMMIDESGQPFVPLTSLDAVVGEKKLQYILDATEKSAGHFQIISEELKMTDLINTIIVVRWPDINSTVKPSYLQINEEEEKPLYNGSGTEYLSLEEASNTVNMLAYDGSKWILTSGAGSSGSGHVITNEAGETMEQQKILNFVGFQVENDGANRLTRITNPEPINNLTTSESGLGSLDAYQGKILSQRSVPTGGTKGQVLAKSDDGDYLLTWADPGASSADSVSSDGSVKKIVNLTYAEYKELESKNEIDPLTQYYINDMSDVVVGPTEASMVEFADGTNLEDKMATKDIIDNGQNDRLDIAESNIDTMADTINTISSTVSAHTAHINSYTPCQIVSTSTQTSAAQVISALGSSVGHIDVQYMSVAATNIDNNIGSYIGTNPNISTGGPNFQAFVSGTTTLYTAILTTYTANYIVLLRRVYGDYYGTYIGPV